MTSTIGDTTRLRGWAERVRNRDDSALNELLIHFEDQLIRLARRMLRGFPDVRSVEQTGDVLQKATVRLVAALRQVSVPENSCHFFRLAALQIRRELIDLAVYLFAAPCDLNPSIPKSLEAVCLKALALEPGNRYASPAHLAEEIERSLADEPVSAWVEPWWIRARRLLDRHRTRAAALFTAILVGLAALAVIAVIQAQSNRDLAAKNQELRIANLRAERRVDLATQAIENFSKVVSENPELTGQPTLRSLRKRLLAVPLDYYRQLKADVEETQDASPESRAGLAKAIIGLASVTAEIDSQANALKSYKQAVDLLDPLLSEDPSHVDRQVLLARVLGEVSMIQRSSGSLDAARASLNRARQQESWRGAPHASMAITSTMQPGRKRPETTKSRRWTRCDKRSRAA